MFHDIDIVDVMKLHGNVEMLKENVSPRGMCRLHDTKSRAREDQLIVSVGQIIAFHKIAQIVNQAKVHAAEHQDVFSRGRIGATLGRSAMNFHGKLPQQNATKQFVGPG